MNPTFLRILLVVFLLAHGYIHMSLAWVPVPQPGAMHTPFFPSWWRTATDPTWPVMKLGLSPEVARPLGWLFWVVIAALYTLGAAVLLISPSSAALWQGLVVGASALSVVFLGLYWHPWLPVGVLIDLALIAAVLLRWPVFQFAR